MKYVAALFVLAAASVTVSAATVAADVLARYLKTRRPDRRENLGPRPPGSLHHLGPAPDFIPLWVERRVAERERRGQNPYDVSEDDREDHDREDR